MEIRTKNWLVPQFVETLRERGVALTLIDPACMLRPAAYGPKVDAAHAPGDKEGAAAPGERTPAGMAGASKIQELSWQLRRSDRCSRKWIAARGCVEE